MSQILNLSASVFNFDAYLYYFRYPPSDACERLKDGLTALNYLEVSDREEIADVEEVCNIDYRMNTRIFSLLFKSAVN